MSRQIRGQAWVILALAGLALAFAPTARAEEAVASKLDSSEARDFLGKWTVTLDMMNRKINFGLHIVDLAGKVGATIDSEQSPEPTAIDDIAIDERGHMVLKYPMKFGQQEFKITVNAEAAAAGLEGKFVEDSGLFSAPFTAALATGDDAEIRETRSRNRRNASNSARLRFGEEKVNVNFHPLPVNSEDHKRLEATKAGEVFEFVGGRATKLMTDVNMKFAQAVVKKENAAPNYPGVYSLWLRKTADGWELVFNNEADIWGTMHSAEADAAAVKLESGKAETASETFKVALDETPNGGVVRLVWGDQQWSAPFEVEGFVRPPAPAPAAAAAAPVAPATAAPAGPAKKGD